MCFVCGALGLCPSVGEAQSKAAPAKPEAPASITMKVSGAGIGVGPLVISDSGFTLDTTGRTDGPAHWFFPYSAMLYCQFVDGHHYPPTVLAGFRNDPGGLASLYWVIMKRKNEDSTWGMAVAEQDNAAFLKAVKAYGKRCENPSGTVR